jgi:hypothetical protein
MRRLLSVLLLCVSVVSFSQQKDQLNSKITIRGMVGIPKIVSSQMFRTTFNGVVETGLSVNIRLFGNVYAGAGYEYSNFLNNKREWSASFTSTAGSVYYSTQVKSHGGYVKIGYDHFFSKIGYVSYALNTGLIGAGYFDVRQDSSAANQPFVSTKFVAPFLQPELSLNFLAEKNLSFALLFNYTTMLYKFDPKAPRLNHISQINEARNRYFVSWINIGIGFTVHLDSKRK